MYICNCNPFTDKDLDKALSDDAVLKTTSNVYKACSGGEMPCCGTCICEVKKRVGKHLDQTLLEAAE